MTDTPTSRLKLRKQSLGSNVNTWGDTKVNDAFDTIDRASKGYQALAITGDTTLSWTNYSATNDGQVANLKLTGSLTAVAALIVPSTEWSWDEIHNATGQAVTVRTSAGTGIAIPNGYKVAIYCDGTDCYNRTSQVVPGPLTVAGAISGVSTPSANTDAANKSYVDTAIATAGLPATAGTVLVSGADTTAGYLGQKITSQISSLTTTQVSGLVSVSLAIIGSGSNEQMALQVGGGYVGGFLNGGTKSSQFTPVAGTEYNCDFTSSSWTVNLGGMTTPQVGHRIKLNCFGNYPPFLLGTVNGQTNFTLDPGTNGELAYSSSTWGWN